MTLSLYCPDPKQAIPRDVVIQWICDEGGLSCQEFRSLAAYPVAAHNATSIGWKLTNRHLCPNCSGK